MKKIMQKIILVILCLGLSLAFAGCTPKETTSKKIKNSSNKSILLFNNDENSAELIKFFKDGNVPKEVDILYDQMGANPEITITDSDTMVELYNALSEISVEGESNQSITDCYHHIQFVLDEDNYVYFSFEGNELWCYNNKNYNISNSGKLFGLMKKITDEYIQQ